MKAILLLSLLALIPHIASAAEPPAPHLIVKDLYAAHASDKSPFFQSDDRTRLDPFFTKALGDLLFKDVVDAKGDLGRLDFDPLYGSQDPQITDFVIGGTGLGGDKKFGPDDEAVVQVTFKDSGVGRMISFRFRQGKDKVWLIEDVRYPDLDDVLLMELLSADE
jgi:hypothetical protein